jgi:DNA-binding protein H-NS
MLILATYPHLTLMRGGWVIAISGPHRPVKALCSGRGRIPVATRTRRITFTKPRRGRHGASALVLRHRRHWCPRALLLAIIPLVVGSCAELVDVRTDLASLRADLHTHTEALSQLSGRVEALEHRQAAADSTARQTQQALTQAIEVLLKKALVTEDRLSAIESGRSRPKAVEKPDRQVRPPLSNTPSPAPQVGSSPQDGRRISLGMTQEDVRLMLGEPISIENAGSYVFWQYSQLSNQKYVVFEKSTGQVSGWRGF